MGTSLRPLLHPERVSATVPASLSPTIVAATPQRVLATTPVPSFRPQQQRLLSTRLPSYLILSRIQHERLLRMRLPSYDSYLIPRTLVPPRAQQQRVSTRLPSYPVHPILLLLATRPCQNDSHTTFISSRLDAGLSDTPISTAICCVCFMHCISLINRALDLQLQPQLRQRMSTA
jgi:hypothetical protein